MMILLPLILATGFQHAATFAGAEHQASEHQDSASCPSNAVHAIDQNPDALSLSTRSPARLLLSPAHNWSARTVIAFPGQRQFHDLTERWSVYAPPTYSAVISPATEQDLVKIVNLATRHNLSFLATGGRHGYGTTLGKLRNGLAIDLGQLDDIDIDQTAGTLTVGPGVLMGDVMLPVHDAGYQIQTSSCTTPSMIGVTLGGGITRWSGIYGLISDALTSARIVTASGQVVDVSHKSHPNLFWGLRGAGFNFGIVTRASYQLHSLPSAARSVVNLDLIFSANQTAAYFALLASYSASMPARLVISTAILWHADTNAPALRANWVYLGPEPDAQRAMAPVLQLVPLVANMSVVAWHELLSVQRFGVDAKSSVKGSLRAVYTVNVRQLEAAAFEAAFTTMAGFYAAHPGAQNSFVEFETFPNQAAASVPGNTSAYPWRDAVGNFLFVFSWNQGDSAAAQASTLVGNHLRQTFAQSSGYPHLSVYVSYAHGDEPLESIYGAEQLPRLAALKKEWDPSNVFAYNNPLPTQYQDAQRFLTPSLA
ncbi:hypothetical protein CDD82_335 [Ophiocordyceps australis]|uniref:FAD-binding PCMH-type domain-containing protein n=1 Tax=Ophiocordyceps australis TaxID=1399860 RepID=A0A2C5YP64_9HYPO|nr:hypothetical protein CDD82_335 [Ophiocordyceps australis]